MNNVFANIPPAVAEECIQTLLTADHVRIERIVSHGQASPEGFWYDQPEHEWVLVLQGAATLRFDDQPELASLTPGSFVHIPAHRRHRVEWTIPNEPTIWLAVFYS